LFHVGWEGVIDIIAGGNCQFNTFELATPLSALATTLLSVSLLLFNISLLIISLTIYTKEKGCCKVKGFFVNDDPFGFRVEQFGIIIVLILTVLITLIPFSRYFVDLIVISTRSNDGENRRGRSSGSFIINYLEVIMFFLIETFLLIATCAVGLTLSIISIIKKRLRTPVFDSEFEAFVNTKEGIHVFKEYAKSEWSTENILFYEDILKFREIKKFKAAKRQAIQMNLNFVEIGSPLEVNLSGDVRRLTKKRIENFQDHKNDFNEIFEEALKETKRNMRDTFSRVTGTRQYQQWKNNTKVVIEDSTKEITK
jgi:hypothetical protein